MCYVRVGCPVTHDIFICAGQQRMSRDKFDSEGAKGCPVTWVTNDAFTL